MLSIFLKYVSHLGGFSEHSLGKVEPPMLNSFLHNRKRRAGKTRGASESAVATVASSSTAPCRPRSPRAPARGGLRVTGYVRGRELLVREPSGPVLVKMSPAHFPFERPFYLTLPQPLSSGQAGLTGKLLPGLPA